MIAVIAMIARTVLRHAPRSSGRKGGAAIAVIYVAALVVLLVIYHWHCGRLLKAFQSGGNARSHVWFRFYNEMPVLVLFAVVFLVVLKPF